ncbi:bisphosphate nucleotidase [Cavenderia fasciculata]|uniref:3'(2'),5'-bisphosphate nucleotidase 1 n=1 Tax=Cavenderia fasciculata TaxID=261658 RepID=F4QCS1_CACFS|nr:bisphosphate nucleotidase [Cavenderia fasciculata]EGG13653.1 bisphosphate nucleotidase [Cavenderia fasciculata]|eukprot:XP_004350357.1 bisphosphate nucleotidase [Cavenderia fasciculata]
MGKVDILQLVSACLQLAEESGDIIRGIFNSGSLGVQYKAEDDPFTIADVKSQQHIIGGLLKLWKDLRIVGEENCDIPPVDVTPKTDRLEEYRDKLPKELVDGIEESELLLFLDPLDATREFTKGRVECVMTLLGISYRGKPIAGVIYQPFINDNKGRSVWAVVGMPVVGLLDKRAPEDRDKVILVTSASHYDERVDRATKKINPDKVIRTGGAGFKILMIIENLADVYIFPTVGSKLWDICAPHAVLLAVGGTLTDPSGKDIIYSDQPELIENKNGIVITIGNHQKYIQLLNQE